MCSNGSESFIKTPLVVWLQSYLDVPIKSNSDLVSGTLLKNVLNLIDPAAFGSLRLQHNAEDLSGRTQNLADLLHCIKRFYQEKLQQLIVMKMPDVLMLAKEPDNELSYSEMKLFLLLVLGCAVQCDKKEEFIEHITELDVGVQRGLVAHIQEITENPENIIAVRVNDIQDMATEDLVPLCESLYYQVHRALEQRDEHIETMLDLALFQDQESADEMAPESPRFRTRTISPRSSFRSQNILQANRQKVFNLQSELDDRTAVITDMKNEMEDLKTQLDNLRRENKRLITDASWASSLRDELDVAKSQLESASKITTENTKLKEKVRDMDYYKRQYDEIKAQSDLLYETKIELEEKVASSTSLLNRCSTFEEENSLLQNKIKALVEEREDDQMRMKELADQVAKLSLEKQESMTAFTSINAELDGLRMQKQDDGLNVPLMVEYNLSSSADLMRLESENKRLTSVVEGLRGAAANNNNSTADNSTENMFEYKTMISTLTKALMKLGNKENESEEKSLLQEKEANLELGDLIGTQGKKITKLRRSQSKTTIELEGMASKLRKSGIELDVDLLKEALSLNNQRLEEGITNGEDRNKQLTAAIQVHQEKITTLEQKYQQSEKHGKEVEIQLEERTQFIQDLERRFELKTSENNSLQHNMTLHQEKVAVLEERVSQLLSTANEDTRKINQALEKKMTRISQLETKILGLDEDSKELEKAQEMLKVKDSKLVVLQEMVKSSVDKIRNLELDLERSTSSVASLEHSGKLKDERVNILETSINELSTSTSNKQTERIASLMQSLEARATSIADLERKVDELLLNNDKLKATVRSKQEAIQHLENELRDLQTSPREAQLDEDLKTLQKEVSEKNVEIDTLESRIEDIHLQLLKVKRANQQKEDKNRDLELKLQDLEGIEQQKARVTQMLEERNKNIIDIETNLGNLQNENKKLERVLKQKDEEYKIATQSLCTLEASIADQSSLSKLIKMKETKLDVLEQTIDEKDQIIVTLENSISDSDGKIKRLTHSSKLKDEKIIELESRVESLEEIEIKCSKMQWLVNQKDGKIHQLEDSLDELGEYTRLNSRLKESVNSKDNRIATLEQRIDDLEEVVKMNERLNQQVKLKEERIVSLQERTQELEDKLHKSEQVRDNIKQNAENEILRLTEQVSEYSDFKVKRQMSLLRRDQKIVNLESRLNEVSTEREQKDQRIQDLQSKLEGSMSQYRQLDLSNEEKDQKLYDLEMRITELQDTYKENRKLLRSLQKKEEELQLMKIEMEELAEQKTRTSQQIENKDSNIAELQSRLEETLSLNNRLNQGVCEAESKLADGEKRLLEQQDRLESLAGEIQLKDRLIARSNEKMNSFEKEMSAKLEEIADFQTQLSKSNEWSQEKEELEKLIKDKEACILELEKHENLVSTQALEEQKLLTEKGEEKALQLQKCIDDLETESHKYKLQLQEREGIIKDLNRRIEELELTLSGSDKLNVILKEKNSQIQLLKNSLDENQQLNAHLETTMAEQASELSRSAIETRQLDERVRSLKQQLEEYVKLNHQQGNQLKLKEDSLLAVNKSLDEMNRRNKDLEEDINSLEKDLQDLKDTGSLKNITNITEKIKLTKRARTELHIQRGPPRLAVQAKKIEIKMSPVNPEELVEEKNEQIEKLQSENNVLEKQKEHLSEQHTQLSMENALLSSENESLKSSCELLKLDYEAVQKEMTEAKLQFLELDASASKISNRCEVLVQMNGTLDEENHNLMQQLNQILSQNRELMRSQLQSKEQYLDEERIFSDHIYNLERAREKLADKVQALEDSGYKKKKGVSRFFKKLKKKTSNPPNNEEASPTTSPLSKVPPPNKLSDVSPVMSPSGPIRGLLSRSRQDLLNDQEAVLRKPPLQYSGSSGSEPGRVNGRARPKSEFYPATSDYSPIALRKTLGNSLEDIHRATQSQSFTTESDIVPMQEQINESAMPMREPRRSITPSSEGSSRAEGSKTPIQRVRIKQMAGPEVMKTPQENDVVIECLDYMARQQLEKSPGSARRKSQPPPQQPPPSLADGEINARRTSTPVRNNPPSRQSEGFIDDDDVQPGSFTRSSSTRSKQSKFSSKFSDVSDVRSSDSMFYQRDDLTSPPAVPPRYFGGNRDLRSSFRRYEMEEMEPRPMQKTTATADDNNKVERSKSIGEKDAAEGFSRDEPARRSKRKTWYEYGNV